MDYADILNRLLQGVNHLGWQNVVMMAIGCCLIALAIVKEYEPLLLIPIGTGCVLANLPMSLFIPHMENGEPVAGMLGTFYNMGVGNELFPLIVFIGIGAMTDFGPLLENPKMVLLGAAGQFGIFLTLLLALLLGFNHNEAASIGIIGAIDGPTSIYVSGVLAPHMLGPITVAAYSYMSLVPIIMPPIMRALTTKKERAIKMPYSSRVISKKTRVMFPIIVTIIIGSLVPFAAPLIGSLMLGNLLRESQVVERLVNVSSDALANTVTLFLGLAIGATMVGSDFLKFGTLKILALGLLAFALDTAAGVLFGKLLNMLSGGKFNPLIGAAGISAFPMAARVVQQEAQKENFENFILMHAMGANAAGQVASVVAGGVLLALMGAG